MTARIRRYLLAALGVSGLIVASPAVAEQAPADAEPLISASLEVDTGLALARRQTAENDLLGAVATVERVLFGHPDAVTPRVLYAGLLCRLDDRKGATAELAMLGSEAVPDDDWTEFTRSCGGIPRPGSGEVTQ